MCVCECVYGVCVCAQAQVPFSFAPLSLHLERGDAVDSDDSAAGADVQRFAVWCEFDGGGGGREGHGHHHVGLVVVKDVEDVQVQRWACCERRKELVGKGWEKQTKVRRAEREREREAHTHTHTHTLFLSVCLSLSLCFCLCQFLSVSLCVLLPSAGRGTNRTICPAQR